MLGVVCRHGHSTLKPIERWAGVVVIMKKREEEKKKRGGVDMKQKGYERG